MKKCMCWCLSIIEQYRPFNRFAVSTGWQNAVYWGVCVITKQTLFRMSSVFITIYISYFTLSPNSPTLGRVLKPQWIRSDSFYARNFGMYILLEIFNIIMNLFIPFTPPAYCPPLIVHVNWLIVCLLWEALSCWWNWD